MECQHGRERPWKCPNYDDRLQPIPGFLPQQITKKPRTHPMMRRMEESSTVDVPAVSNVGERTSPVATVACWWGCDRPWKGPDNESLQPLLNLDLQPIKNMEYQRGCRRPRKRLKDNYLKPLPDIFPQPITKKPNPMTTCMEESTTIDVLTVADVGERTLPEGTVECPWGCNYPWKGPHDESLQPPNLDTQPISKKSFSSMITKLLHQESVTIGIPKEFHFVERIHLEDTLESRRGRGRPRKRPDNDRSVGPLSLSQSITEKARTITLMTPAKERVTIDITESDEEITPTSNSRNLEDLSYWNGINTLTVSHVGGRTPPNGTVECRRGCGRPRKRLNIKCHRPLTRSNTHMALTRESVTLDISQLVEERTPYSNAQKAKEAPHWNEKDIPEILDVGEKRIPPEATAECRRGRGRPRKITNNKSLRPLLCSLWEQTPKRARTSTSTLRVLKRETVTTEIPKLVEEITPPSSNAQKIEELPYWSGTTIVQLSDVGDRTPSDEGKAEELPNCNDKEERNDDKRAKELSFPPHPTSKEVLENSRPSEEALENCPRPSMWDFEIPGPIPDDIFELPWEYGTLSNFWCGPCGVVSAL